MRDERRPEEQRDEGVGRVEVGGFRNRSIERAVRLRPTGYAVTLSLQTQFEEEVARREGLELGEKRRLVVVAEMVGRAVVGLRRPADSAETPQP